MVKVKLQQSIMLILLTFLMIVVTGCTSQAWYEGGKYSAESKCRSQQPSEIDRCLDRLNKRTYEEYEKERSDQQ